MLSRLETVDARRWAVVAYVLLHPVLAWLGGGVRTAATGDPAVVLTSGLSLALLLLAGVRTVPLVALAGVVSSTVVLGVGRSDAMVVALVEAIVLGLAAALLADRFERPAGGTGPRALLELVVVGAIAAPIVVALGVAAAGQLLLSVDPASASGIIVRAAGDGIGVLTLTAGIGAVAHRGTARLLPGDVVVVVGGVAATAVLLLGAVLVGEAAGPTDAQVAFLPLLLVGFVAGSTAFSLALGLATVATLATLGTFVRPPAVVEAPDLVLWWAVVAAGLLLAADGDRRRRVTSRLATLFDHAAAPSAEVDGDGRVVRVNRAFAAMLGWRQDELVDTDLLMLFSSEDDGAGIESMIAGRRQEVRGQARVDTRTGGQRMVRFTGRRFDDEGTGEGMLLVQMLDMTDEERRADELERSNDALERVGNRISHDLKQPLAAIAGYASTLKVQRHRLDDATTDEMLDRLDLAARRVVGQLDSLVESARVGGDEAEPVRLSEVVSTVAGLVDIELRESSGAVETSWEVECVRTDPRGLQQVLFNLVTNSLKYHDDALPLRLMLSSRVRGRGVEIMVADNGPGIAHHDLESVFEAGRRLDPGRAAGRGMGLPDSRRVVEELGGWLRAEPSPAGARFVLWLPDPGTGEPAGPVRVVSVDSDSDEFGRVTTAVASLDVLDDRIVVVGRARTVAEAVELVATLEPDVVLVDRWTGDGESVQALAALATSHPTARLVVRTSDRSLDTVRAALVGGATRALDNGADGREVADVMATVAG